MELSKARKFRANGTDNSALSAAELQSTLANAKGFQQCCEVQILFQQILAV